MHNTDLTALAEWLRAQGRHKKLVGLVDRAGALGTISEDLRECGRCLDLIERLQGQKDLEDEAATSRDDGATIAGALFSQAIILYARATAQGGNNRMALLHDKTVPAHLLDAHKRIQTLRSEAIAHYGTGEEALGTPLVREAVVFSFQYTQTGVREQTNILATRAQHKVEISHDLKMLVSAQLDRIECIKESELCALRAELEAAVKDDPDLGHALPKFPFDPYSFCGTEEAALSLAMGLQKGKIDPLTYAVTVPKPRRDHAEPEGESHVG